MEKFYSTTYLRLSIGEAWGLTLGVTEGVPEGVDCADVESLSSLKSPLGILSFCRDKEVERCSLEMCCSVALLSSAHEGARGMRFAW